MTTENINETPNLSQPKYFSGSCKKGDIWFIKSLDTKSTGTEIWSDRPAVIVSNEGFNSKAGFVNVVYLTTSTKQDRPFHVDVISGGKEATALCEQIHPVDKSRISFYIGSVTDEEMLNIDKAMLFTLSISNSLKPNTLFQKWLNAISRYNIDLNEDLNAETNEPVDGSCSNETDEIKDLIRQRDQYKMLYEREKQTIEDLMQLYQR